MTSKLTQQRRLQAFADKFDKLSIDGKRALYVTLLVDTNPKLTVTQALAELDAKFPRH